MSPNKKRRIPHIDLTPYLEADLITIKPKDGMLRVEIGKDRCRTLVMDETTALSLIFTIAKQGKGIWSYAFAEKILTGITRV